MAAVEDACSRASNGHELFSMLSERVRKVVPFDGAAWFGMDPKTILPSAPVRVENIEEGHCESYWIRESTIEDALLYRDLARAPMPAGSLFDVTDDSPARSARYREFLAPQGYGDELRAVCKTGSSTWGTLDLFREKGRTPFSAQDLSFMAAIGPLVATALRSLATASRTSPAAVSEAPGTALFLDGALLSLDDQAEQWFAELAGPTWRALPLAMTGVYAVVARAQAVAEERERGPAAVRLRAS